MASNLLLSVRAYVWVPKHLETLGSGFRGMASWLILRNTLLHHHAKFGHSRSNYANLINGDPPENKFDPCIPPFKVIKVSDMVWYSRV